MANVIHCDTCGNVVHPVTERRPVDGVASVGFECPSCKTWYHAYWHNDELEQERQTIEAMTPGAQSNPTRHKIIRKRWKGYHRAFDRLQNRMAAGAT